MKIKVLLLLIGIMAASVSHAVPTYWNAFNIEGESSIGADIVTYTSLTDMLMDSNRSSVNTLSGPGGANVVGSGASLFPSVSVPEPPALALLFSGIVSLIMFRRMKSAQR